MPTELPQEILRGSTASFLDLALFLVIHIYADIYLHLRLHLVPLQFAQVDFVCALLARSKIF